MKLRIATWNINSVRLRLALVERFTAVFQPDVLCLQEIKCREDVFPYDALRTAGFNHIAVNGQAGYHGVATLSKLPLGPLPRQRFCGTEEARHLGSAIAVPGLPAPLAIHNLYIPAGGDEPDPDINPKFKQKLAYLRTLREWCAEATKRDSPPAILLGDFNVAPLETDVWSHKQLLNVVSHTPIEVEHLEGVRQAGGWVDIVRRTIPPEKKLFSWWSYRARDWSASDRGRRLDHIWSSASIAARAGSATVFREARGWPGPSDHAPVIVDLAF